ncbi:MAG: type II toxin-antitoxin system prevent-host-death family antitoxin [Edaphobacter sp.]
MATAPKPLSSLKARAAGQPKKTLPAARATRTPESISASKAKTHLLELLNTVDRKGESVIITKRGRPVAKLVPIEQTAPRSIFGWMKGSGTITGDVVGPEPDIWNAMVE